MVTLVTACFCYLFDSYLFNFERKTFCNWQMGSRDTCEQRNEGFMLKVLFFFIFWAPLWFACSQSMRRYSQELIYMTRFKLQDEEAAAHELPDSD